MLSRLRRRAPAKLPVERELFLSALSGLESGIAMMTAIVIGLEISGSNASFIATAAYITLIVQAFNASSIRYVSLRMGAEIDDETSQERRAPFYNAAVQFISHITAGSMPILPLFFLTGTIYVALASFVIGVLLLIGIGLLQGRFLKIQASQNVREIMLTGLLVILVGVLAGLLLDKNILI